MCVKFIYIHGVCVAVHVAFVLATVRSLADVVFV